MTSCPIYSDWLRAGHEDHLDLNSVLFAEAIGHAKSASCLLKFQCWGRGSLAWSSGVIVEQGEQNSQRLKHRKIKVDGVKIQNS